MAVSIRLNGTLAQVTAAINNMQPSSFPGQPAQLARVQAAALAEIAAFPGRANFAVNVECHRDNITSVIDIRISPVGGVNKAGDIIMPMATLNDNEL